MSPRLGQINVRGLYEKFLSYLLAENGSLFNDYVSFEKLFGDENAKKVTKSVDITLTLLFHVVEVGYRG